jgi:hypothetical protein
VKCCIDTNVLDWVVDNPRGHEILDLLECGALSAIVAADNGYEVHRIPDGRRKQRDPLQALLKANFFPLAPTHVPIAGIARAGHRSGRHALRDEPTRSTERHRHLSASTQTI